MRALQPLIVQAQPGLHPIRENICGYISCARACCDHVYEAAELATEGAAVPRPQVPSREADRLPRASVEELPGLRVFPVEAGGRAASAHPVHSGTARMPRGFRRLLVCAEWTPVVRSSMVT